MKWDGMTLTLTQHEIEAAVHEYLTDRGVVVESLKFRFGGGKWTGYYMDAEVQLKTPLNKNTKPKPRWDEPLEE